MELRTGNVRLQSGVWGCKGHYATTLWQDGTILGGRYWTTLGGNMGQHQAVWEYTWKVRDCTSGLNRTIQG